MEGCVEMYHLGPFSQVPATVMTCTRMILVVAQFATWTVRAATANVSKTHFVNFATGVGRLKTASS